MIKRRIVLVAVVILFACLGGLPRDGFVRVAFAAVPERLADQEFWKMISDISEPAVDLPFDNLMSNEILFQHVIPDLTFNTAPRRAYLGVGPEQNFTYIAALKPSIAFVVDIRRGNMNLHLLYKALFELSADRAEFVSRLFSKPRPRGLGTDSTATEIFDAYSTIEVTDTLYQANLKAIKNRLIVGHRFGLSEDDLGELEYIYSAFVKFGPQLRYSSTGSGGGRWPSYLDMMKATDNAGEQRGYLAYEEEFAVVKDLQSRNLIVPIVGNFAGPKAIRTIGQYLKSRGELVSAFYLSNVEQFLRQDGIWDDFCENVAALPLDNRSIFIRSTHHGSYQRGYGYGGKKTGFNSVLGRMATETKNCATPTER